MYTKHGYAIERAALAILRIKIGNLHIKLLLLLITYLVIYRDGSPAINYVKLVTIYINS